MARSNKQELAFSALTIEGGLLAPDFLNKVAHLEASEQTEADYDIPRGLKLRDEIGRHWKIAQNLWQDFVAMRARTDIDAHAITVRDFLEPLLRHALCFGDLKPVGQMTLGDRQFPIGFSAGEGRVPLVLAAHTQNLEKPDVRFGDGLHRRSPFLLAQEYLNANDDVLWAIVSNGLRLRVLRDNPSLTRPAYIEADLEAIFSEGLYPDFTALWLLAHSSRFGQVGSEPVDCPLERWRETAQEDGIRARDRLRIGVTEALRTLGTGFLSHPANTELRHRLEVGEMSTQAYFEQLLRLIYRFIFLATIEDRGLLFAPSASEEAKARYIAGYSLTRLRRLAARRSSYDRHADLWQALSITFSGLGNGQVALGLPALGGLYAARECLDLDGAQIDNGALLSALFSLCFFRDGAALSRVNYRDMDSEELGSVYESLLELVPHVTLTAGARHFGFIGDEEDGSTKGNARKLTGSYYTPDSLVQQLVKSALEPVIERTLAENPREPVRSLLALSVCDPACGSGHFLLAAARRIAEEVARLNAVDGNPLPADYRRALRDVVAHCIYGVDKNPMAVELARTALWLEAYTPERPLTFLDAHLRCGDALLGVLDPAVFDTGIPDKAFNALSGDDKDVVKRLKKANRDALKAIVKAQASSGQFNLGLEVETDSAIFESLPDDTLEAVEAKRAAYAALLTRMADSRTRLAADLFVAAFVLPKTLEEENQVPTSQDLWLVLNGSAPRPGVAEAAHRAAEAAQALHWWQAFPQIKARGGFDVMLGNPPWEVSQFTDEEFFCATLPSISGMRSDHRRKAILDLQTENPRLWNAYQCARRLQESLNLFFKDSGRYPKSGVGRSNLYGLFIESIATLMNVHGRSGFIVPTGFATDDNNKYLFESIAGRRLIASIFDFENRNAIFSEVHRSYKFSLVTLGAAEVSELMCFATSVSDLADTRRRFLLSQNDFALINPNTRNLPVFRTQCDAELTIAMYKRWPVLWCEGCKTNEWKIDIKRIFNMGIPEVAALCSDRPDDSKVTMFEAKMFHQYDHRWFGYGSERNEENKSDPSYSVEGRYYIDKTVLESSLQGRGIKREWLLAWRDVCRSTDERTVIASIIPNAATDFTARIGFLNHEPELVACFIANMNSIVLDFVARQKIGSIHLSDYITYQLPFVSPSAFGRSERAFVVPRILELTYTANDLKPWAEDLGYDGAPFPWNPERRSQLRAELDAYYAHLYGLTRDELRYILDPTDIMGEDFPSETFRVLKNNDMREYGEFRTRRLVLEAWDRLAAEQRDTRGSTAVLSEQGVIRNTDSADFAGIVFEVIKQYPDGIAMGDLQALVAYALQPIIVSQYADQATAGRLTELMSRICRFNVGDAVQLVPDVLHRLQSAGVCRTRKSGDTFVYAADTGVPPHDVRITLEHTELGSLLFAFDLERKRKAEAEQIAPKSIDSQKGVA